MGWGSVCVAVAVVLVAGGGRGAVIPPPWVNQTTNPCSTKSWQLLYWPQDGSCHHIFTQGPCGETQEFYYEVEDGRGRCRCPRGALFHTPTRRCFPHYSRGPCPPRQYLDHTDMEEVGKNTGQQEEVQEEKRREEADARAGEAEMRRGEEDKAEKLRRRRKEEGECRRFGTCPPGQVYWPHTKTCHQYHTRGPCLNGALLYVNPATGMPECGCERSVMFSNYWPLTGLCFELFQRGPCPHGHIFLYNATSGATECGCNAALLTNYHTETNGCYELDQQGPCHTGHIFTFQPSSMAAHCTCRPHHALHPLTGACYRLYSRGPCQKGHFFTPSPTGHNTTGQHEGQCQAYPCSGPRRYHPITDSCNRLGWRGPCPSGRLFIYHEDAPLVGECGCLEELAGYWRGDGRCYEVGSRGPCTPGQVLAYRKSAATSFCTCDLRKGFIKWQDGQCYRRDTQGPCHPGQVLVLSWDPQPTPICTNLASGTEPPHHHRINSVLEARHLHRNTTIIHTTITPSSSSTTTSSSRSSSSSSSSTSTSSSSSSKRDAGGAGSGRSGRSMGDSEVWGSLEGLLPPGHYFTGRSDGRRGLTPWWGAQPAPPHKHTPTPG